MSPNYDPFWWLNSQKRQEYFCRNVHSFIEFQHFGEIWSKSPRIPSKTLEFCPNVLIHRIGWWENLQESPMVKTMVSCRFSLKPIHWLMTDPAEAISHWAIQARPRQLRKPRQLRPRRAGELRTTPTGTSLEMMAGWIWWLGGINLGKL